MKESREKEGIFGEKYTEHVDDVGNKIGESREREGLFGDKYTEHTDHEYRKTGESREQEGFLGDKYAEHTDSEYRKTGESREREGILGDKYIEHFDNEGNKVGESQEREGIFGDKFTEHTGNTPHQMPSHEEDLSEEGGIWELLAEKAAIIGAAIGAILGLMDAVGSATDLTGYLLHIGGGAFMLGAVAGLMVRMLPWGIALGVIVLLLKACGNG